MKKKLHRKLRQGALNTALCLLCAAACVLTVVAADYLESKYDWQLDYSFNNITTQGEATENLLDSLTRDVRMYAVFSDGSEDSQLIALLNRYQARTPHITWSQENLTRNPLLLQLASSYGDDSAVNSDCLIIRCEETGRTRVLTAEDYIERTYDAEQGMYRITGWQYEKSISEAILYVTADSLPRMQLLSGHGELDEASTTVMEDYLTSANYDLSRVNLLTDGAPDPDAPLMILSPTKDLSETELQMLTDYVQAGGDLFITVSYTDPDELPNFYALYRLYGFEPIPGLVLEDEARTDAYYESIPNLTPKMLATDATGTLVAAGYDTLILAGARALETPTQQDSALSVYVALESTEGAYIRTLGAGSTVSIERQADDRTGPFALALCASRVFDGGQNSRAFIIGNDSMFLDNWMYAYTYSGELLLQVSQYLQGKPPVDLDILSRPAVRQQLNVSNVAAPVVLLTLLLMLVAVLAVAVLLPRRHL